ncbi:glucosamine-fructose-6-phosphate aminotransferase [Cardiosporidium cionae]|uniref:glutamine--fructose-6-phosphate transaminase (isomerizing) n=1 Tax=Cardiosporidium cionae TaxID=476202 RepID=A0ABQ7J8G6_9APIC|nr:glucosamine-fructose-6-phosphate aminotransferase [Cardiosporidium cionae]|eukprot:KAF8820286.1 glucosamine-fructose-6-phosphate aminotransferase [Cardiosporidium cionae]
MFPYVTLRRRSPLTLLGLVGGTAGAVWIAHSLDAKFSLYKSLQRSLNGFSAAHEALCKFIIVPPAPAEILHESDTLINNQHPPCINGATNLFERMHHVISSVSLWRKKNAMNEAMCCGIVGFLGDKEAIPFLVEGITMLQNRGYDSCGISTRTPENTLVTTKCASCGSTSDCVKTLTKKAPFLHSGHTAGIGHTRWATHGGKTDDNAHPHHDFRNRISLVHNGTIDNYLPIKKKLMSKLIPFKSETDTEVIANLIGYYMDEGKGNNLEQAVQSAIKDLEGTWGLCILPTTGEKRLILARHGSPLLVGTADGNVLVSSEPAALIRYTNHYIPLNDDEVAIISPNGIEQFYQNRNLVYADLEVNIALSPAPFDHWTLKEIFEQPQSLARAMNFGGRLRCEDVGVKLGGLDSNKERLSQIGALILSGCGTSYHAALFGEQLFQWIGLFDHVKAVDAAELMAYSLPKHKGGIILLSQSGETLDTIRASQLASESGLCQLSIVNAVGSHLARLTKCGVYLNAGREVGVASTKSFTSQVTVLALVALWFSQLFDEMTSSSSNTKPILGGRYALVLNALQRLPMTAESTLELSSKCYQICTKIKDASSLFILGRGFYYPVALEGALKIKEISYIHAEGFSGGSLKHGPFALIDESKRTPVICIILSDESFNIMRNAALQVKARGAHVICITTNPEMVSDISDEILHIPDNGPLTTILCSIGLQLLAYHLAVSKGIDPDKPRGLAKTVTVY